MQYGNTAIVPYRAIVFQGGTFFQGVLFGGRTELTEVSGYWY